MEKDFSKRNFYQQFKKNVYFCKLNFKGTRVYSSEIWSEKFDEKKNKNNIVENEKNVPTFAEKKSKQARFPQENVYRQR